MRVCSFAVALVHIDASTCMCNILQSIPTQLNNLAMQLQTSWGVGPLSSTIQCYMDLSRALYVLSCHGYGHMLAVRLISVPLQCGIAVLLSMEPTAHRDNDSIFCLGGQVFPRAVHRLHFSISSVTAAHNFERAKRCRRKYVTCFAQVGSSSAQSTSDCYIPIPKPSPTRFQTIHV
jgi:hypothetical protein